MKRATRSMRAYLAMVAILLAWPAAASAQSQARCKLMQVAELPVRVENHQPIVEASINGKPARLLLDTGAFATSLFSGSADRLGLHLRTMRGIAVYGVGGRSNAMAARVSDFALDRFRTTNLDLMVLAAGTLGQGRLDGVLGEDILSQTDLELDLADGKVRMIIPDHCQGDEVVYWNKAFSETPMLPVVSGDKVDVEVRLNGAPVRAEIDSGAETTVATLGAASSAGVRPTSIGVRSVGRSGGIGEHSMMAYRAVFPTFAFGDETIKNADIRLADLFRDDKEVPLGSRLARPVGVDFPQMLLGADFLMSHRVYVSRKQRAVYVSYVGGPVFADPAAPSEPSATAAH